MKSPTRMRRAWGEYIIYSRNRGVKGCGGSLAPFAQNLPQHMAPLRKGSHGRGAAFRRGSKWVRYKAQQSPAPRARGFSLSKKSPKDFLTS